MQIQLCQFHKCKKFIRNPVSYQIPARILRKCHPVSKRNSLKIKSTIWQDIVNEDEEIEAYIRKEKNKNVPSFECASNYVKHKLYPLLIPAFEKVCAIFLRKDILIENVRFFNFIDMLTEVLHNTNPIRKNDKWMSIHLIYTKSDRPWYPYFWFLTPHEAATKIQTMVRGFMVRQRYNLAEMKEERRKVLEGIEKQKTCYNAFKDDIQKIYM